MTSTATDARPDVRGAALAVALTGVAAACWLVAARQMRGMDMGPGSSLGSLSFFTATWATMMTAMMLPSAVPAVLAFDRGSPRRPVPSVLFVAGYLIAWTAVGLVFYAMISLGRAVDLRLLGWDQAGPYIAGGVIAAAGLYQFTPAKQACLRKCRGPFEFLLSCWRPGRTGALWMGIKHGGWCVGCCWALMAALFALGVMSIGWMAFIAALIAIEKLLPWRVIASRGVAVVLLVLGLSVALLPHDVPDVRSPAPDMQMAVT